MCYEFQDYKVGSLSSSCFSLSFSLWQSLRVQPDCTTEQKTTSTRSSRLLGNLPLITDRKSRLRSRSKPGTIVALDFSCGVSHAYLDSPDPFNPPVHVTQPRESACGLQSGKWKLVWRPSRRTGAAQAKHFKNIPSRMQQTGLKLCWHKPCHFV